MPRLSFNKVVGVAEPVINRLPSRRQNGTLRPQYLVRRKFSTIEILSMALKCLTTQSKIKDLHSQFGAVHACYVTIVELGINTIMRASFGHNNSIVEWERSDEGLMLVANIKKYFFD